MAKKKVVNELDATEFAKNVKPSESPAEGRIRTNIIDADDNRVLDTEHVERLAQSIERVGLLEPILINRQNKLIAGGHRLEAFNLLFRQGKPAYGWIPVVYFEGEETDEKLAQIHENSIRSGLSLSQKIEAAKWIEENLAGTTGKPRNLQSDDISQNFGKLGKHTEDLVVEHGIFGNKETYRQAKHIANNAIDDVITNFDKGEISLHRAYQICKAPKERQPSLLTRILAKRSADLDETPAERKAPAATKVKSKTAAAEYDFPTDIYDKYNVIRVAPDWWNETLQTICSKYAVANYVSPYAAVCLEVPTRHLNSAFDVLDAWKLHYRAIITICWNKYDKGHVLDYISQEPLHIVIGQVHKTSAMDCVNASIRMEPVCAAHDPYSTAIDIITDYFAEHTDGAGHMLDMSATEPRDGWDIRELKFRRPQAK